MSSGSGRVENRSLHGAVAGIACLNLVVVVVAAAAVRAAEGGPADDPRVAAIRAADDARIKAMVSTDARALAETLSDSLRYAHSTGIVDTKESFLDLIASGRTRYLAYEPLERTISFPVPGLALDAGRAKLSIENAEGKADITLSYLATWREEDGRWKFLAWQSARLPAGAQPRSAAAGGQPGRKPNILVIWGDDIGTWNISHTNRGMMGWRTPNIDRIAREGVAFTDYYGQQSCTAGRAAFLGGNVPVRTGMTKVGLPGAKEGWQKSDVTIATVMKSLGYATGQFGKNHQGDRDEHLPTMHGFDEFFGNLYHLNAEEEPENRDYPRDMKLANGKTFLETYGPRGVLRCKADGRGGQTIENTGPLTKKRMETIDEETVAAAKDYIQRQSKAGKPFFCWWNGTRMHFRTHVKEANLGKSGQDEYGDGMVEHDVHVGELLALLDELGIADDTIVLYSTDNGPHYNTWPDAGTTPFRSEKNSNWEGAYRVPAFIRWPGRFPAGVTLTGIVSHEDWLPTFAAAGGDSSIKEKLAKGTSLGGRSYRNFIDGYDQLEYLSGRSATSPRNEFFYVNDDGQVVAIRYADWKVVFLENRGEAFGVWREPFTELRVPLLFNLRRDPFEKSQHHSNTYNDWFLDRAFVAVPLQQLAGRFLMSMKEYPPSQTPGSFNLEKIQKQIQAAAGR